MPRIPMTPLLARLAQAALVLAALIAFALAILPTSPGPASFNDKIAHALTFFVLAGLTTAGFRHARPLPIFLALTGFGGLIEIAQWATDWGRSAEWLDLAADMVGAALGIIVARLISREP